MRRVKTASDIRKFFSESNYLRCPTKNARDKMERILSEIDSAQSEREAAVWQSIAPCMHRESDPSKLAEEKELLNYTASLLDRIPTRDATVLLMIYWNGLTLEKAGRRLGVTRERVRQILCKSLRRLRSPEYWKDSNMGEYVEGLL